ncbi:hypothetical protein TNCV_5139521 [Trichonephila clavipes]|nr:hypothetical protein TNCV_5139521 [Trichonephila clavipes]
MAPETQGRNLNQAVPLVPVHPAQPLRWLTFFRDTAVEVSAANGGVVFLPVGSCPDAVVLYSGCTPGSAVPGICQMTGFYCLPLLDSVVGGSTPERRCLRVHMDPMQLCPGKGLVLLKKPNVDKIATNVRFFLIPLQNVELSKKSPFSIHKALIGIGGEPKPC